jgi:cell division protein FtsZ
MVLAKPAEPKAPPVIKLGLSDAVLEREMEMMEEEAKAEIKAEEEIIPAEPEEKSLDYLMPKLVEEFPVMEAPVIDITDLKDTEDTAIIHLELQPDEELLSNTTNEKNSATTVGKMSIVVNNESINSSPNKPSVPQQAIKETDAEMIFGRKDSTSTSPVSAASGGYLARPSNIYAESKPEVNTSKTSAEKPVSSQKAVNEEEEELLDLQMQLVERDDIPAADMPLAHQAQTPLFPEVEDSALQDETEEQKRRAAERLHKLRNLSFNVNAADPNNEFETVPAYIRRNMELYNSNTQVENFYSSIEVKTDQNNQTQLSTINTFLDGNKPD